MLNGHIVAVNAFNSGLKIEDFQCLFGYLDQICGNRENIRIMWYSVPLMVLTIYGKKIDDVSTSFHCRKIRPKYPSNSHSRLHNLEPDSASSDPEMCDPAHTRLNRKHSCKS